MIMKNKNLAVEPPADFEKRKKRPPLFGCLHEVIEFNEANP